MGGDRIPGPLSRFIPPLEEFLEVRRKALAAGNPSRRRPSRRSRRVLEVGQVSPPKRYVVEYDLPSDSRRKRFYRAIRRYLSDRGLEETSWSTQSVVFTESESFAWEIYKQARKVGGVSHVYEAERLDDEP